MTHQRDGTYLVKSDEEGLEDIVLRTMDTPQHELFWMMEPVVMDYRFPDLNVTDAITDRVTNLKIGFQKKTFALASEKTGPRL
jgi:hypothetical protein